MCHQFQMPPRAVVEEVARLIAAGALETLDFAADQLESGKEGDSLFPGDTAPVILATFDEEGTFVPMPTALTWGFEVSWSQNLVYNTRMETACDPSSFWADALEKRRCIVPVQAFFETHRTETARSPKTGRPVKRRYRFTAAQGTLLYLAGIYGDGRFSLVTVEPGAIVGAVHDRSPLALTAAGADAWLRYGPLASSQAQQAALSAAPADQPAASTQLSLF